MPLLSTLLTVSDRFDREGTSRTSGRAHDQNSHAAMRPRAGRWSSLPVQRSAGGAAKPGACVASDGEKQNRRLTGDLQMNRFFSKLDLRDIKIDPQGSHFP